MRSITDRVAMLAAPSEHQGSSSGSGGSWGGKRQGSGAPRRNISVRGLPRELVLALERRAREAQIPIEELARRALEYYVAHTPEPPAAYTAGREPVSAGKEPRLERTDAHPGQAEETPAADAAHPTARD